jgi:hypothetical protein
VVPEEAARWPSIVDGEDVRKIISQIVDAGDEFEARFYQPSTLHGGFACQGDIIQLRSAVPFIDSDGNVVSGTEFDYWMILSNTCDLHREDEQWALIVPVISLPDAAVATDLRALRRYEYSRKFYLPPWCEDPSHHLADFTQFITIDKSAFTKDFAKVVARLRFESWALLHACIVRYLARDDGRFD